MLVVYKSTQMPRFCIQDDIYHSRMAFQRMATRVREIGQVQPDKNKNKGIERPERKIEPLRFWEKCR